MKVITGKSYKRVSLFALSLVLAISGLGVAGSVFLSQTVNAVSGVTYNNVPFTSLGLSTDRSAPSGGYSITSNSLQLNVDNNHANASSHFYQTEGFGSNRFAQVKSVQATLSVPSAWQGKPIDAGLWGVSSLSTDPSATGWPIIAFISNATDAYLPHGATGFAVYNTFTGDWTTPSGFNSETGWDKSYNLEINYNPSTKNFNFYVNGTLLTSYAATDGSDSFDGLNAVIFDNFNSATGNSNDNYSVNWTNFKTGNYNPAAPTALRFKNGSTVIPSDSTFNNTTITNNTDLEWLNGSGEATDAYQTQITYPDGSTSVQWTGTKTLWIGQTVYVNNYFGQKGDGTYSYKVKARSAVTGLWSDWSTPVSLNYDTHIPTATFTSAPDNDSFVNGNFDVAGTAQDNVALQNVFFDVRSQDGSKWVAGCASPADLVYSNGTKDATISCTINTSNLANGVKYMLRIHAGDYSGYGNVNSDAIRYFTIDRTAPTVPTLLTPLNKNYETTNNFYFTWTTSSDIAPVTYEFQSSNSNAVNSSGSLLNAWDSIKNGNSEQNNLTTPQIHSTGAPDGTYYWQVRAIDSAGNKSAWTTPWEMTIDKTAPNAPDNLTPGDGTYITSANLTKIDWTEVTDSSMPVTYYYQSSHSNQTNSDGSFTNPAYNSGALTLSEIPTPNTPEGTYYWHVRAVDAAGNSSAWSSPWKITVDNTAPVVSITSPNKGDVVNGTVTVSGTVKDNNPDHYYFVVKDSTGKVVAGPGVVNQANVTSWSWDTTQVADGTYTIDLEARDAAGNKDANSVQTINVVVDNMKPTVLLDAITSPVGGSTKNLDITGTVNDANLANYQLTSTDDATGVVVADTGVIPITTSGAITPYTWDISSLPSGTYTVTLTATDVLGQVSSQSQDVTVDNTPPTIFYNVADNSVAGNKITPNITVVDPNTPYAVNWTADTSNPVGATYDSTSINPTFTLLNSGTYNYTLTVTDALGNTNSQLVSFSYTAPQSPHLAQTLTTTTPLPITPLQTTNTTNAGGNTLADNNGQVLGDQTTKPSTDNKGSVKGAETTKSTNNNNTWSFLGLAWYWWLLILAVIAAIWWLLAARNRRSEQSA